MLIYAWGMRSAVQKHMAVEIVKGCKIGRIIHVARVKG